MADDQVLPSRRRALQCIAFGGLGTLFTLAGGVLVPIELSAAAEESASMRHAAGAAKPLFVQISDTHIGFSHAANPAQFDLAQQLLSGLRTKELHTVPGEHDVADAASGAAAAPATP